MKTTIKRCWVCLLVLPALSAGGAWAQEAEPEPVFAGTPAQATGPEFEPVFEGKATPSGPQYDEAGNLIPVPVAWAGPVATPRQLAAERATVDEYAAMLGSGDLGEQLDAVTVLANLADRAWEPMRIRALLEAARSDRDVALATHADVSLKRLDGIETLTAAERRARALANEQSSFDEYSAMLGSKDLGDRMQAVKWFANEAGNGNEQAQATLIAAQSDRNSHVSAQAGAAVAALAGAPVRSPQERAALTRANDQESSAEYTAMLSDPELANRMTAISWLANAADNGNPQARAALHDARRAALGADPLVAAEVDAILAKQAARGLTAVD